MIEYPYIPTVTGKIAEQLAEQTEYNAKYLRGSQAPTKKHRAKVLKNVSKSWAVSMISITLTDDCHLVHLTETPPPDGAVYACQREPKIENIRIDK